MNKMNVKEALMESKKKIGVLGVLILCWAAAGWAGNLSVSRVWPERIVYKPGETAVIDVTVSNVSKESADAKVSLEINYGLDATDKLPVQTVTVPANSNATAKFTYKVPEARKWTHEAAAAVLDNSGAVQATGREYFTVGRNQWELGFYTTVFGLRGARKSGHIDNRLLPDYRRRYITTIEYYSWAPSVFDGLAPERDVWRSGWGGYKESKEDMLYLIRQAHKQGMAVTTYYTCLSTGVDGFDFVRRHPDWLTYDKNGRPHSWFDVDKLTAWHEDPESQPYESAGAIWTGDNFLPGNAHVGDWWIDLVIKSTEMFGWDGIRSDGTPGPANGYDYKGNFQEWPDKDAAEVEYNKKIRQRLTERFPNFLFGWNNVAGGYPPGFLSLSRKELQDVLLPDSYSLYEHYRSAGQPRSVFYPWKKGVYYLQQETEQVRARGGFSHAGWMPTHRYLEAIASACGVNMDSWSGQREKGPLSPILNYRRFEFRWAEFLWDSNLRYVRPGETLVQVEGPEQVWWKDFVHTRTLPDKSQRVIVHLINMPKNDDEAWADRPPAPAGSIKVTFKVPEGKKIRKVAALSPDTEGDRINVPVSSEATITLPGVTLWTVVVAEFK